MRGWFINRSTGSAFKIMIMTAIIKIPLSFKTLPFFILLILHQSFGLTTDGIRLLSFKYSVLSDPLGVLDSWSYTDDTPCSWHGVVCENRCVTGLSLPSSSLTVTIPANLGSIPHLREVNLSNNSISGSIPLSLYNAPELETLDLSNNLMSGEFEFVGGWRSLRYLNMSGNSLTGKLPQNLAALKNLTVVSLTGNRISGDLPSGFESVEVLDLSSNSINGSLPEKFGSGELVYFNISHNNISGEIPKEFANKVPITATIDLSFNKLKGPIPESDILINQDEESFVGNPELCGKPLKNLCETSSTSGPPNSTTFTPAIAGIPQTFPSTPSHSSSSTTKSRFKTSTIIGIIVGDIAIVAVLALIFIYLVKKRRGTRAPSNHQQDDAKGPTSNYDWGSSEEEHKWLRSWACLLKRRNTGGEEEEVEESNQNSSSENSDTEIGPPETSRPEINPASKEIEKKGLVTVDGGENELELETLLKASAYILGTTGSSIIYKAVLEDGTMLAVRRIGENGLDRFKDFENQVRVIAKLVHPNLVRIRGFYWAADEKLVIYDYVPHGSLANARYKKVGSSPSPLPWEVRLKIAKGTARGLLYIHDKKQVHGNLKPSNILLESDMEPKIGDFGLERLLASDQSCKVGESRNFGSKRSNTSRESFPDIIMGSNPSPSPSSMGCISPYYAPESLRNLKPNPKWDVYSYGVVLLELLTGRVIISDEFGPASMTWSSTLTVQDKKKVLRMVDTAIYADLEGKEDALLALLRLAYGCISPIPQKRPHMKEMVNALEKFPSTSFLYY